jgi:hypothetical protein
MNEPTQDEVAPVTIDQLTDERDLWKSLAIRAYQEKFNVDMREDDQQVWFDIEDAFETSAREEASANG